MYVSLFCYLWNECTKVFCANVAKKEIHCSKPKYPSNPCDIYLAQCKQALCKRSVCCSCNFALMTYCGNVWLCWNLRLYCITLKDKYTSRGVQSFFLHTYLFYVMCNSIYQNAQFLWNERAWLAVGLLALWVSMYWIVVTRMNQKRSENLLHYQYKLEELKGMFDKSVEAFKESTKNNDMDWHKNLQTISRNQKEIVRVYEKMKKQFSLDDI